MNAPSSHGLGPKRLEENFLHKCRGTFATEGQRELFSRKFN